MPDPAKTPEEIEDVLASIRRLVSDHSPESDGSMQSGDAQAGAVQSDAETASADALVLTPSFRVTDPEDPWVPVASSEPANVDEGLIAEIVTSDAEEAPVSEDDAEWQPDDRLASFDAVGGIDESAAEAENETPEIADWVSDEALDTSDEDVADLLKLDGSEASASDFESETGDDDWPEGAAEAALLTLVARRDPGADKAADEGQTSDSDQPDVGESQDSEDLTKNVEETDKVDAREDEDANELDDGKDDDAEAEAEAGTAERLDDTEETGDAASDEDAAGTDHDASSDTTEEETSPTPIFARHVPASDIAADGAPGDDSVEDLGEAPQPFSFPETEDGILDEDTLREIIVDVVREELQGVLGQRITRNVRKMVRREIRMAIAAEDLE